MSRKEIAYFAGLRAKYSQMSIQPVYGEGMIDQVQAKELVAHFGGVAAAARAAGVPRTTLAYWLDPEPHRDRTRDHYYSLEGMDYTRRQHQIDMARRARRIKSFTERKAQNPTTPGMAEYVSEGLNGIVEDLRSRLHIAS